MNQKIETDILVMGINIQKAACERFDKVHNKVDRLSLIYEIKLIRWFGDIW